MSPPCSPASPEISEEFVRVLLELDSETLESLSQSSGHSASGSTGSEETKSRTFVVARPTVSVTEDRPVLGPSGGSSGVSVGGFAVEETVESFAVEAGVDLSVAERVAGSLSSVDESVSWVGSSELSPAGRNWNLLPPQSGHPESISLEPSSKV
jgi:hypothetical protein